MSFKIYQIKRKIDKTLYFVEIGEMRILNPKTPVDDVLDSTWHACNVFAWDKDGLWEITRRVTLDDITMTITEYFTGVANSDIIITNEKLTNLVPEIFGWKSFTSLNKAMQYLIDKYSNLNIKL